MNIPALTEQKQRLIVNNVLKACEDISKLNKTGYDFLYLANGFIAHYDINGFKDHYSDNTPPLRADIIYNQHSNQWNNFHPGQENYEYYMSKKSVYNAILEGLVKG